MNSAELIKRLQSELGEQAAPRQVVERAGAILKESLQSGGVTEILGLLRVQLLPQALTGEVRGREGLNILPLPGLIPSRQVNPNADKENHAIALAVDKIDTFTKIMEKRLLRNGRQVVIAEGAAGLMAAMKQEKIDAVVMEASVEMADDIRQWLKTDPERSAATLFLLYQEGQNRPTNSLVICEDASLTEPYEDNQLCEAIDNEIARLAEERKHFVHMMSFDLPADPIYQQQAAELLESLTRKSGLTEEGRMGLIVGFREALDNAIRHGSKNHEDSTIHVGYVLDKEKVTVTIRDPGPGFDSSVYIESRVSGNAVATARTRHKEGRRGGLGIMLMLKSLDKLEYNREGNVAILTKYLKPQKK